MFFKPVKTVGVFCTIFPLGVVPALPAAAANTLLLESSSISALKPALARDLMVDLSLAVASEFRDEETVITSPAKALTADLTLVAEGVFPDAAFPLVEPLVDALVDAFAVEELDVDPFAAVVPPVDAFVVDLSLEAELFAADVLPEEAFEVDAPLEVLELEDFAVVVEPDEDFAVL